jgi:PAS domain S-box-containing protein
MTPLEFEQVDDALAQFDHKRLIELADEAIFLVDQSHRFLDANDRMCQLLGYTREEMLCLHCSDCVARDEASVWTPGPPDVVASGVASTERRLVRHDGSSFLAEVRVMRVGPHLQGIVRDITDRRRLEADRLLRDQELRTLVENAPDVISRVDRQFRHRYVNRAVEAPTGIPASAFIGKTNRELGFPKQLVDFWEVSFAEVFMGAREKQISFAFPSVLGERYYQARLVPEFDAAGAVDSVLVVARDVTAEKLAERELKHYAYRLADAQEFERRRIAYELHDEVGQQLTGLTLLLSALDRDPASAAGGLAEAQAMVSNLLSSVRDLSLRLRPPMLDDFGLLAALLWLTDHYRLQTGIQLNLHHVGLDVRFPPEIETAVFRIVQEALTNTAKHAQATCANAEVIASNGSLTVTVHDNGHGFDQAQTMPGSSGLIGMRQRAEAVGGTLRIQSGKNKGTIVIAHMPVED